MSPFVWIPSRPTTMWLITTTFLVHYCQYGRGGATYFFSIPAIHAKFDCKQATFHIPIFLLPVTRQIFYKRYVCDIGQRVAYSADWADFTRTNRRIEVVDSGNLEPIARELPRNDLFKSRIRVTLGSAKAVTITVYYTTGTVLVQGNRCHGSAPTAI